MGRERAPGRIDHRRASRVIAQLSAFGVSPAKIAKRTRAPRSQVDAALAVAGSELAKAAAVRYGDFLDVVQAAVVAEFDDDPEAVKALVAAAKTGQFDHTAQRLRDARAEPLAGPSWRPDYGKPGSGWSSARHGIRP